MGGERVTNAVLEERMKNQHDAVIIQIKGLKTSMDKISDHVEANTNFRLKCKGAIAVIASISAIIGGFIATKLSPYFSNLFGKG